MTPATPIPTRNAENRPGADQSTPARGEDRLAAGRRDADQRRYERVLSVITQATTTGRGLSVAAAAHAAGVHRSYLYRHPDLLDLIHEAARTPASAHRERDEQVSTGSLRADLAHARDRATRAECTVRDLRARLSRALGQQVWAETGIGADAALDQAQRDLQAAHQALADAQAALAVRDDELAAARAANRELMAALNTRQP